MEKEMGKERNEKVKEKGRGEVIKGNRRKREKGKGERKMQKRERGGEKAMGKEREMKR
jgi:hypothetical protein